MCVGDDDGRPTRKTDQRTVDAWNAQLRQSPVYLQFMQRHGLPTNGRVKLSRSQQEGLERALAQAGMPVPGGMHIPGLSEKVAPRIGRFGQVVTREGGPVRRAADPFNVSSMVNDSVSRELDRLGVVVSLPSDRLAGDRPLTREQEIAVMQRRGQTVRRALEQVMNDQRYSRLDDAGRTRVIRRLLPRVRAQATTGLRRELQRAARRRADDASAR